MSWLRVYTWLRVKIEAKSTGVRSVLSWNLDDRMSRSRLRVNKKKSQVILQFSRREKQSTPDDEARLSWGTNVKTKHLSLTSLAFMRLVPGDDRTVRHICIRLILFCYNTLSHLAIDTSSCMKV